MVMDGGKIVEFDTPLALLDDPRSKFMRLLTQSGEVDPMKLRKMAAARAKASGFHSSTDKRPHFHQKASSSTSLNQLFKRSNYDLDVKKSREMPTSLEELFVEGRRSRPASLSSAGQSSRLSEDHDSTSFLHNQSDYE
jgi:ABC-type proline/glycine betaine transport system ATPase subunit